MSTAQGRVLAIGPHSIQLSMTEQSACGNCHSRKACGAGSTRELAADAQTLGELRVGDQVELHMHTGAALGLALLLYAPPAIGFVAGILLASAADARDAVCFVAGVAGLAAGFVVTRALSPYLSASSVQEIRKL